VIFAAKRRQSKRRRLESSSPGQAGPSHSGAAAEAAAGAGPLGHLGCQSAASAEYGNLNSFNDWLGGTAAVFPQQQQQQPYQQQQQQQLYQQQGGPLGGVSTGLLQLNQHAQPLLQQEGVNSSKRKPKGVAKPSEGAAQKTSRKGKGKAVTAVDLMEAAAAGAGAGGAGRASQWPPPLRAPLLRDPKQLRDVTEALAAHHQVWGFHWGRRP
jgi:hypothetical protein